MDMNEYLGQLEQDHGRMVALQAICEAAVLDNDSFKSFWSSTDLSAAYRVAFSSMFQELAIVICRLLDRRKDAVSLVKLVHKHHGWHSAIIDIRPHVEELLATAKSARVVCFRNTSLAHNAALRKVQLDGEIAAVYSLCDDITQVMRLLAWKLGVEFKCDGDNITYWQAEGASFWRKCA